MHLLVHKMSISQLWVQDEKKLCPIPGSSLAFVMRPQLLSLAALAFKHTLKTDIGSVPLSDPKF